MFAAPIPSFSWVSVWIFTQHGEYPKVAILMRIEFAFPILQTPHLAALVVAPRWLPIHQHLWHLVVDVLVLIHEGCNIATSGKLLVNWRLPSGKHTKNYGKYPFLTGKSTISMAMFNSCIKLSEGTDPALRSKNHTPDSNQGHTRTGSCFCSTCTTLHCVPTWLIRDTLLQICRAYRAFLGVGEMSTLQTSPNYWRDISSDTWKWCSKSPELRTGHPYQPPTSPAM